MKEEIIDFETSVLAKKAGFDWEVRDYYKLHSTNVFEYIESVDHNEAMYQYSAPKQAVLQKWLREEKELSVEPNFTSRGWHLSVIEMKNGKANVVRVDVIWFDTYELALQHGLKKALELLTKN